MSAPMTRSCFSRILTHLRSECTNKIYHNSSDTTNRLGCISRRYMSSKTNSGFRNKRTKKILSIVSRCAIATGICASAAQYYISTKAGVHAKDLTRQEVKPTRRVQYDTKDNGLKLTLFQFITCPFCCKVRAFLDYHGISYDVVEVHSVWKTEIKWTDYKKVPILVCDGMGKEGYVVNPFTPEDAFGLAQVIDLQKSPLFFRVDEQMNDSSMIMSLMSSFMYDPSVDLETFLTYYPAIISEGKRGKKVFDYPNRYFIMYQENVSDNRTPEQRKEERKWRKWVDEVFVHVLSPNVYRTPSEAVSTFKWFSEAGEWEKVFSSTSRAVIIYAGSLVMYFVAMMLKRKYDLREDVRMSLYDMGNAWVKGLEGRKFQGGDKPNLADLSMYGVLTSIEGTGAFKDMLSNTKLGPWFYRTKDAVMSNMGAVNYDRRN